MLKFVELRLTNFFFIVLTTLCNAASDGGQGGGMPLRPSATANPPVLGLNYVLSTHAYVAGNTGFRFYPGTTGNQSGVANVVWSCKGGTEIPNDPNPQTPFYYFSDVGTYTATAKVTYVDGTTGSYSTRVYIIGGPLSFTGTRKNGPVREEQTGFTPGEWQPLALDYLGYDPGLANRVKKKQQMPTITVSAQFARLQPAGTKLTWASLGMVSFFPNRSPTGRVCRVCAHGWSHFHGDSSVMLTYTLVVNGSEYQTTDRPCTNPAHTKAEYLAAEAPMTDPDPTYNLITCRVPLRVPDILRPMVTKT